MPTLPSLQPSTPLLSKTPVERRAVWWAVSAVAMLAPSPGDHSPLTSPSLATMFLAYPRSPLVGAGVATCQRTRSVSSGLKVPTAIEIATEPAGRGRARAGAGSASAACTRAGLAAAGGPRRRRRAAGGGPARPFRKISLRWRAALALASLMARARVLCQVKGATFEPGHISAVAVLRSYYSFKILPR